MNPKREGFSARSFRPRMKANEGFTLLEVLVALTVLAVGATLTLSLISGSLGNIRKVQSRTRVIDHAQSVMELALLDESIQGPTSFSGDFDDGIRWSVNVEEYESQDSGETQFQDPAQNAGIKLLHYTVEMYSSPSNVSDFNLQTLKLIRVEGQNQPAGIMQ